MIVVARRTVPGRVDITRMGLEKIVVGPGRARVEVARARVQITGRALHWKAGGVTPARRVDARVRLHRKIGARIGAARQNVAVAMGLFVGVRHFRGAGRGRRDRVHVRLMVNGLVLVLLVVLLAVAVVVMVVTGVVDGTVVVVVVVGGRPKKDVLEDGAARAGEVRRPGTGHRQRATLHLGLVEGFRVFLGDLVLGGRGQDHALLKNYGRHGFLQFRGHRPAGQLLILVLPVSIQTLRRLKVAVRLRDLDLNLPVLVLRGRIVLLHHLVAAHRRFRVLAEIQHVIVLRVRLAALLRRGEDLVVITVRMVALVRPHRTVRRGHLRPSLVNRRVLQG